MYEAQYEAYQAVIADIRKLNRAKSLWLGQFGIKPSELRVLMCLKEEGCGGHKSRTISELSKQLQVTSPTVTQMVNHLISNGYLMRTPNSKDRRVRHISLTEKGECLAARSYESHRVLFENVFTRLGQEKSDQLMTLLKEATEHLQDISKEHHPLDAQKQDSL